MKSITSLPCPSPHSGLPLSYSESILTWTYSGPTQTSFCPPPTLGSNFLYHLECLWLFTSCFFCFEGSPVRSTLVCQLIQCLLRHRWGSSSVTFVVWFPLSHLDSCAHCFPPHLPWCGHHDIMLSHQDLGFLKGKVDGHVPLGIQFRA